MNSFLTHADLILDLLDLVAERCRKLVFFLADGLLKTGLEFEDFGLIDLRLLKLCRDLPFVDGILVHIFQNELKTIVEGVVTGGATEAACFFEILLAESALGTEKVIGVSGLHVFRRSESQEHVRKGESGRIGDSLFFGAFVAEIDLLHFSTNDLGQVDVGKCAANLTFHIRFPLFS
jgi:hypothetical protein